MNTELHGFSWVMRRVGALIIGLWLAACTPVASPPTSTPPQPGTYDPIFTDYPTWTRLTAEPQNPSMGLMLLCMLPSEDQQEYLESEHGEMFVNVFVNTPGAEVIQQAGPRLFPVGTIIVKEKLTKLDSAPTGWGVMVKREAGFNPTGADWEYIYRDADGTPTTSATNPTALAHCQACHLRQQESDSVFWPRLVPEP